MISKSQYIRGQQCLKSLWLFRNRRDLLESADSATTQRMDSGTAVAELAQQSFPKGDILLSDPF